VWSFGVVLWELFSLGRAPYPGMRHNEILRQLLSGYRMDKPEYANNEIGQLMSNCWKTEPKERPTFHQLEEALGRQFDSSVKEYYLELNEPYAITNFQSNDKPITIQELNNKIRFV
jgi:hypothetical protein